MQYARTSIIWALSEDVVHCLTAHTGCAEGVIFSKEVSMGKVRMANSQPMNQCRFGSLREVASLVSPSFGFIWCSLFCVWFDQASCHHRTVTEGDGLTTRFLPSGFQTGSLLPSIQPQIFFIMGRRWHHNSPQCLS